MENATPMMKQFLELKKQYKDCILLFRAGDFYETFYDDAKIATELLNITLTKRGGVPMAGVPFHSVMPYIKKLIDHNKKVAICEQLEDPKKAKGLVKRGITRIITPGTILEDEYLKSAQNNFVMCIYSPKDISEKYGISFVDISTGEFFTTQLNKLEDVKTIIKKYSPSEIVLNESSFVRSLKSFILNSNIYHNFLSDMRFNKNYASEILKKQFGGKPEDLGLDMKEYSCIASGALLFYIYKLQKLDLSHINTIQYIDLAENMIIDEISLRNLEIVESIFSKDQSRTLFGILNKTCTSAGSRLLKNHLCSPLLEESKINKRLDGIEELNEFILERDEIRELLREFRDIERITSRITSKIASPRDLFSLRIALEQLPKIKDSVKIFQTSILKDIKKIDTLPFVVETIKKAIVEDAPSHRRDIGYIKKEFNSELNELCSITYDSKNFLNELEEEERLKTGISTLKIRYNRVFGYYIEVPKAQMKNVPSEYETKQTLANATRYSKEELKQKEQLILGSEEKIKILENEIFEDLLEQLKNYTKSLQNISSQIALLDVLTTHSLNSQIFKYSRPVFSKSKTEIKKGRNAIVERFVSNFISNNTFFNETETLKVITGPNMSGKSTYLRQIALITILAQMGSFVPADSSTLKIYNRIFTRIGAHDDLSEGQSTFMVEMNETANILNNAKNNSLVLLDEIGRGTSTYDGLSIAWAITEDLANKKIDCCFATHYHQLNKLSENFENVVNYNVLVKEEGDKVEFMREIVRGGTDKSYGIYVAKLAGVPDSVVNRAQEIQKGIEENGIIKVEKKTLSVKKKSNKNSGNLKSFI